ncbi:DUF416 family protein [Chitinophaga pollutisoli]|uniref:DUF416 family protein n=1 Tax=Chitinophaga pollutisoli TaxID=3133966 RepID=A0ABZ2YP74_9BACT
MAIEALNNIQNWDIQKKLTFAYLTCQRLFPNYRAFHLRFGFGEPSVLSIAINSIYNTILNAPLEKKELIKLLSDIDSQVPQPEDFDTVLASSALDACTSIESTLEFIKSPNDQLIKDISTMATDSVDMYIQESDDMDYSDKDFEQKITNHPLMQKELKIQNGIASYLNKIEKVTPEDIDTLLQLQDNNGKGNLEL